MQICAILVKITKKRQLRAKHKVLKAKLPLCKYCLILAIKIGNFGLFEQLFDDRIQRFFLFGENFG